MEKGLFFLITLLISTTEICGMIVPRAGFNYSDALKLKSRILTNKIENTSNLENSKHFFVSLKSIGAQINKSDFPDIAKSCEFKEDDDMQDINNCLYICTYINCANLNDQKLHHLSRSQSLLILEGLIYYQTYNGGTLRNKQILNHVLDVLTKYEEQDGTYPDMGGQSVSLMSTSLANHILYMIQEANWNSLTSQPEINQKLTKLNTNSLLLLDLLEQGDEGSYFSELNSDDYALEISTFIFQNLIKHSHDKIPLEVLSSYAAFLLDKNWTNKISEISYFLVAINSLSDTNIICGHILGSNSPQSPVEDYFILNLTDIHGTSLTTKISSLDISTTSPTTQPTTIFTVTKNENNDFIIKKSEHAAGTYEIDIHVTVDTKKYTFSRTLSITSTFVLKSALITVFAQNKTPQKFNYLNQVISDKITIESSLKVEFTLENIQTKLAQATITLSAGELALNFYPNLEKNRYVITISRNDILRKAANNRLANTENSITLKLILGDELISNSVIVDLANNINLLPSNELETEKMKAMTGKTSPLPDIQHIFRNPEPRAPFPVSFSFSLAILFPTIVILLLILVQGVKSLSNVGSNIYMLFAFVMIGGFYLLLGSYWFFYDLIWLMKQGVLLAPLTLFFSYKAITP